MKPLKLNNIAQITDGTIISGDGELLVSQVSTDTRETKKGDLFIAIKGDNFNGHEFINKALDKGASAIIVSEKHSLTQNNYPTNLGIIYCENTKFAYQKIASNHRKQHNCKVIAITGSNGKTTTKELINSVISSKYNTLFTVKNNNNQVGVPKTLLELNENHEFLVIEIGMNKPDETKRLAETTLPDIGIITNIAEAHLEFFKTKEHLALEKSEIIKALPKSGIAVLNKDNVWYNLLEGISPCPIISFGEDINSTIRLSNIFHMDINGSKFEVLYNGKNHSFSLPVTGIHNIYNTLSAIVLGFTFDIPLINIQNAIAGFKSIGGRMQTIEIDGITIIDDSYNSSPQACHFGLKTLNELNSKRRKIAILGDMFELGAYSEKGHREVGNSVAKFMPDMLITVGEKSKYIAEEAGFLGYKGAIKVYMTPKEASISLKSIIKTGDILFIKGSRGMKMETIINDLYPLLKEQ